MLEKNDIRQKSTLSLAYLGDAVYESLVREYLMENSNSNPAMLHTLTVAIVCAKAQSEALTYIEETLSYEEVEIVRRGRNSSKAAVPRSSTPQDYRAATALEALFGYLAMMGENSRIKEIFSVIAKKQIEIYLTKLEQ